MKNIAVTLPEAVFVADDVRRGQAFATIRAADPFAAPERTPEAAL